MTRHSQDGAMMRSGYKCLDRPRAGTRTCNTKTGGQGEHRPAVAYGAISPMGMPTRTVRFVGTADVKR